MFVCWFNNRCGPYPKKDDIYYFSLLKINGKFFLINKHRAGSSAIDFTQLGHREYFGTK